MKYRKIMRKRRDRFALQPVVKTNMEGQSQTQSRT